MSVEWEIVEVRNEVPIAITIVREFCISCPRTPCFPPQEPPHPVMDDKVGLEGEGVWAMKQAPHPVMTAVPSLTARMKMVERKSATVGFPICPN